MRVLGSGVGVGPPLISNFPLPGLAFGKERKAAEEEEEEKRRGEDGEEKRRGSVFCRTTKGKRQ